MLKYIFYLITIIVTSMYCFPVEFTFLLGVNTKMCMAGIGLLLIIPIVSRKIYFLNSDYFVIFFFAAIVSLVGLVSVAYNETSDFSYATYLISMLVWVSAAYVVTSWIRIVHGYLSIELLFNYLIAVCVFQCISALLIDAIPGADIFLQKIIAGFGFEADVTDLSGHRLYGIGAALDVAGTRFAAVLIIIAYMITTFDDIKREKLLWIYLSAFFIISIIGNMIARTTTIGVLLALVYWVYSSKVYRLQLLYSSMKIIQWFLIILVLVLPLVVYLYLTNQQIHDNMRFAFEGFFSLAEKGRWEVTSNDVLKNMYSFPETMKTWILGDGYFEDSENFSGFYMGTDVGYLRFIFYFGLMGLMSFCVFMGVVTKICMKKFGKYRVMFLLLLMLNFIIWFKVSTDIFLIFALFVVVEDSNKIKKIKKKYENSILHSLSI